ncbi:uncharacterized protein LOC121735531 isoform X2 [Aricia agestis]|uniref:uncharacterized protein LOC121735531 isoform X2 n=1 Tax=Aricia agestis TaxID=91739 RepID=UPI001C20240D|nr:uncharacterized protein LOC121735531 isoform X2 [Aricia agestis]
MSEKKCCVPGCIESGGSHRVLHLFPNPEKERERFNAWLMVIGGDVLDLENDYIYRRRRVCHAHFEEKYCCHFDRISNIAVPTQRMPDPLGLSKTSFFLKERRPSTLTQQSSECLPSTSRDTVLDVAMQAVDKENIPTNTMGCSKKSEQILIHSDTVLDVAMQAVDKENIPTNTMGHNKKSEQKSMCNDRKKKQGMTMVEQELYHELVRLRVKLSKLKNKMKAQSAMLKTGRNITSNEKFRKLIEDLPCAARLLTMMQFREIKKKDKGRRFTLDEKILSLAIFKQSAKSYCFLRKMLILPAPQTLVKLLEQIKKLTI